MNSVIIKWGLKSICGALKKQYQIQISCPPFRE